jgi:ferrous iron transport protein B
MSKQQHRVTIALVGNPNCGKTTLFNALTGSDQRVGNWPGVTVEKKEGNFQLDKLAGAVIDLPGIYTLIPDSEDEVAARTFLATERYDLVVNIVDAANLERNLYLTMQLKELEIPMLLVVNKMDIAAKNGIIVDTNGLSKNLGIPITAISANKWKDIELFSHDLGEVLNKGVQRETREMIQYPEAVMNYLEESTLPEYLLIQNAQIGRRSLLLGFLEGDTVILDKIRTQYPKIFDELTVETEKVKEQLADDPDIIFAEARYEKIQQMQEYISHRKVVKRKVNIDDIVLHKFWGIPIFFGVMYLVFLVTMTIGGAFIDFFDIFFGAVFVQAPELFLQAIHAPDWVTAFLAGGIGGGIQTISTFIPVIFFMFLMLGILEDSGYMTRAAFVMDKFMRFVGLPGKAFVPMLVGFGCTVPAILATRTLENKRDRFLTIFMIPFMSCSARLPVYALFAAAFFSKYAGLVVFSLYIAGILLAMLTGVIMKKTLFKGSFSPFIMELPEYNLPDIRKVIKNTMGRLRIFVFRAGKVILIAVVILTVLNSWGVDGSFGNEDSEKSVLSVIGKTLTPIFIPMGITRENWPATVGLFTGIFAKEAIIGTLNSLYTEPGAAESNLVNEEGGVILSEVGRAFQVLGQNFVGLVTGVLDPLGLQVVSGSEAEVAEAVAAESETFTALKTRFTPASAYAYLLFVLIYFPCVAALGAAFREIGKLYGTLLVVYLTLLAWVVSVLFFQIAAGHSLFWIAAAAFGFLFIYLSLIAMGKRGSNGKIHAAEFF